MKHKETNSYNYTIGDQCQLDTIGHNLNLIMKYLCFRINACAHEK